MTAPQYAPQPQNYGPPPQQPYGAPPQAPQQYPAAPPQQAPQFQQPAYAPPMAQPQQDYPEQGQQQYPPQQAAQAPVEQTETGGFFGGAPTITFDAAKGYQRGMFRGGLVKSKSITNQTDMKTGAIKTYKDGSPMRQMIITLQTAERSDPTDDGERRLFLKGDMGRAARTAFKAVGASDVEIGSWLYVAWVNDKASQTVGFSAQKLYDAKYARPGQPDPLGGQVQYSPPAPPPQQQAYQPPAAPPQYAPQPAAPYQQDPQYAAYLAQQPPPAAPQQYQPPAPQQPQYAPQAPAQPQYAPPQQPQQAPPADWNPFQQ